MMAVQSVFGALLLMTAALWPRQGEPVLVAMPIAQDPAWLFGAENWQVGRLSEAWGVRLAWLHPATGNATISEIAPNFLSPVNVIVRARYGNGCQ
jgi:hypothetical protein